MEDKLTVIIDKLRKKREALIQKQSQLKEYMVQNKYLAKVKRDYDKMNEKLEITRQQQTKALELILYYIADLSKSTKLTDAQLSVAKKDYKTTLQEIEKLKSTLSTSIATIS